MSKLLITKDYERFVFEALSLNESDFVNYYLNIIIEHYKLNSEIFEQLETVINKYIEWYKNIVYGKLINVTWPDGKSEVIYENQTYGHDEQGNKIPLDLDKTEIPLIDFKINRHINKSFFDKQIKVIHDIETEIKKGDRNNFIFDIFHYLKLDNNDKKRLYVNSCIAQADKISDEQNIKECDFIILKIREYCSIMPLVNGVPDVTKKMIEKNDALILNYVLDQRKNKSNFLEIEKKPTHSEINHEIEMSFNNIIKPELEKLTRELTNHKQQTTSASKSTGTLFVSETLKKIILDTNINTFLDYEQRLIDGKYFDEQGTWLKSKIELVAFIMILDNNSYFKKKITGKKLDFSDYSNFFESRYKIDISQQSKPSYRKKIKISGYFHFITSAD
ncbi:MAG TPA: hypothetical protein PKW80_12140 [Bacteroidales bacterium]|nr:hypothetical protein [Bacteroidales bacterium]